MRVANRREPGRRCTRWLLRLAAVLAIGLAGAPITRPAWAEAPGAGPMSRTAGTYAATDEGARIEKLLDEWRFAEGEAALQTLARSRGGGAEVLYLQGYTRFLSGDYPAAVLKLRAALEQAPDDVNIKSVGALAAAAGKAIEGHKERQSKNFILRFPPEDEVLADYALDALEAALANLSARSGLRAQPAHPRGHLPQPQRPGGGVHPDRGRGGAHRDHRAVQVGAADGHQPPGAVATATPGWTACRTSWCTTWSRRCPGIRRRYGSRRGWPSSWSGAGASRPAPPCPR